jgi:hypothetical protein
VVESTAAEFASAIDTTAAKLRIHRPKFGRLPDAATVEAAATEPARIRRPITTASKTATTHARPIAAASSETASSETASSETATSETTAAETSATSVKAAASTAAAAMKANGQNATRQQRQSRTQSKAEHAAKQSGLHETILDVT